MVNRVQFLDSLNGLQLVEQFCVFSFSFLRFIRRLRRPLVRACHRLFGTSGADALHIADVAFECVKWPEHLLLLFVEFRIIDLKISKMVSPLGEKHIVTILFQNFLIFDCL